jgi:citrate lyase beta subunit
MRLLQRHPDETARGSRNKKVRRPVLDEAPFLAALGTRDEARRRDVPGGPPTLERWDLVESRWSLASVLVLLAGAALAVLGVVAAARTGINATWYRPVEQVAGLTHTPLLAALETAVGVLLVIAGLAGARALAALVCIAGAVAAGVAAIEAELVAEELALARWWAITLAAGGAGLAVVSMVPWPHFVERHYTRAAAMAPAAAPGANTRAATPPVRTSNPAGWA